MGGRIYRGGEAREKGLKAKNLANETCPVAVTSRLATASAALPAATFAFDGSVVPDSSSGPISGSPVLPRSPSHPATPITRCRLLLLRFHPPTTDRSRPLGHHITPGTQLPPRTYKSINYPLFYDISAQQVVESSRPLIPPPHLIRVFSTLRTVSIWTREALQEPH